MAQEKGKIRSIRVADWMTEGVLAVEVFDSIAVARGLMAKHRINQLPVLDDDHLIGIVTDRDIRDAYPTSMMIDRTKEIDEFAEKITVEEVMTRDIFVVQPETPLAQAVKLLRKYRIGSLPVVKSRELVGIITRSDILDFVLSADGRRQRTARAKPSHRKISRKGAKARRVGKS
jgi:acetoin utilization protein AcuB